MKRLIQRLTDPTLQTRVEDFITFAAIARKSKKKRALADTEGEK